MNVASLELCKELYELSGWENTEKVWFEFADGVMPHANDLKPEEYKRWICRAYDLGYLLRKLPLGFSVAHKKDDTWVARQLKAELFNPFYFVADTPEDAAAKLCIELFKQGVLASPNQALKTEEKDNE